MMNALILQDNDLLAKGNDRYVFQHPHDSQLLIKIVIPTIPKYRSKVREVYLEMKECQPRSSKDALFLQKIKGMVETNQGSGQVIVKECDAQGNIARTLHDIARNNEMDVEKYGKLNEFLVWCLNTDVVINSLHCKNIVYAWDAELQTYRFKVIDGFGDKTFLQLSKVWRIIRDKNKLKCLKRMLRDLEGLVQENVM